MRARGSAGCAAGNEASSHSEAYAEPRLPRRWSSPRLLLLVSVLALLAIFGIALLGTATRIHGGAAAYVSAQVRPLLHRPTSSSFDRDAESTFADPSYLHLLPPPPPLRWDMSHSTKAHHRSSNSSARQRHESGAARTRGARPGTAAAAAGGGPVLARLHASSVRVRNASSSPAHFGVPAEVAPAAADLRELRRHFHGRKFLLPLLDQGPNNQFLQFRVALQKAHALNRTLVLPIWLPHNPKFQHFHPGAPATPSRDKRLEQVWYPFDTAFAPSEIGRYVRTIPLEAFRQLLPAGGKLDRCLGHHGGFEVYLRLSRLSCDSYVEPPVTADTGGNSGALAEKVGAQLAAAKDVRFLGFHLYGHDVTEPAH